MIRAEGVRKLLLGEYVGDYLIRLLLSFTSPKDILEAYLRRPMVSISFRRDVEQIARGKFRRNHNGFVSDGEIITRAQRLLLWLDGKDLDGRNPYEILGLSYSATPAQILQRYRILSKRVHPDRHTPARQAYWCARQQEINRAYEILSDPQSRDKCLARLEERKRLLRRLWKIERTRRK